MDTSLIPSAESRKLLMLGAAAGALLTLAVGFNWTGYGFGWYTGSGTQTFARAQSAKDIADFFAPDCVAGLKAHAEAPAMLVEMAKAKDTWERRRAFKGPVAEKLIMLPRQTYGNSELADACVKLALAKDKTAAVK
jgi:hypothetical protein